jgi:hypothetical protein
VRAQGYLQFLPPCYCETPDEYYYYAQGLTPPYDPFDFPLESPLGDGSGKARPNGARSAAAAAAEAVTKGEKLSFREFGTCLSAPNCSGGVPWTAQHAVPLFVSLPLHLFINTHIRACVQTCRHSHRLAQNRLSMHALQVPLMAGAGSVYGGLAIHGLDSLHVVTEETPSCHLPHIHGIFFESCGEKNDSRTQAYDLSSAQ